MHILVAFVIAVALISGFKPIKEVPDNEIRIAVNTDGGIVPNLPPEVEIRHEIGPASEINFKHIVTQQFDYSCGSAALATILRYQLGEKFTETQVIAGLFRYGDKEQVEKKRAFSLLDMKKFVGVLGYNGVGYRADIEDLKDLNMPCIVPIEVFGYRHFTVFKDVYRGHVFLADPYRGNSSYTIDQFEKIWHQNVIFVVYPRGEEQLSLLELSHRDLRFIDEAMEYDILFNGQPPLDSLPPEPDTGGRQRFRY
ncbi:MAG: C39 family peptidase [Thermodesulfobacteriota bacterium]|nr:C39 family peptidase [Thermodesulfobacteriota bacterium]